MTEGALKIAMIGHKRIPSREGGVEIVVEELSVRLVARGHTVHAYNRKGHHVAGHSFDGASNRHLSEYKGVRIIAIPTVIPGKLSAEIYSLLAAVRVLFGRYNCVHFHAEGPCAMIWLPHLFGIRTVATIHGLDWQRSKWGGFASRYLKFGERMAARYADEVIVLSNHLQNYFLETYGRSVRFISNGIQEPEFRPVKRIKEKWGLEKDDYLLFLGRIVPEKGLHYLIHAYQHLSTTKKLVVAGGKSHTGSYLNDIHEQAKGDSRIIFTDFVQGEELQELFSNAYLYILPSDLEGMPLSLLEGMSYGNCCVVSDIPECTEVVEDRAVVFRKGDVEDLARTLDGLIQNPQTVDQYKANASEFICKKYNWEKVVDQTTELYGKKMP